MLSSEFNYFTDTITAVWTIDNFDAENTEQLNSPSFAAPEPFQNYVWRLELTTDGDHFSFFIRLVEPRDQSRPVRLKARGAILGDRNKAVNKLYGNEWLPFTGSASRWGWTQFIKAKKLAAGGRGLLSGSSLTLRAKLKFFDSVMSNKVKQQSLSMLVQDLSSLLGDDAFCNVQVKVGENVISARKEILVKRCSVFAAMFDARWQESKTNVVHVEDVDSNVMRTIITFLQTGLIDRFMDTSYALKLFGAADKYNLEFLKNVCEHFIINGLQDRHVVDALIVAYLHSAEQLKYSIFYYIVNRSGVDHVTKFEDWDKILQYPILVTEVIDECTELKSPC